MGKGPLVVVVVRVVAGDNDDGILLPTTKAVDGASVMANNKSVVMTMTGILLDGVVMAVSGISMLCTYYSTRLSCAEATKETSQ
jgi:hypothetical protein